jgi:hypothetical protein
MNFLLTGFSSDMGFRVFEFEGVAADKSRIDFSVRADLELIKDFGIRLQELPLLCRRLLEDHDEAVQERLLTFTREHMRLHADLRAAERAATQRRRPKYRRPFHPVQTAAVPVSRPGQHI